MSNKTPTTQPPTSPAPKTGSLFTSGMKKLILAGAILLLVALAVSIWATRSAKEPATNTAALHSAIIQITSDSFFPATTTIKTGQSVTWTNYDQQPHWV